MIHLNQAGTSWPKPEPVRAAAAAALEGSPADWAERFAADHAAVCAAFGVADPDRLLPTPGATTALSVAVLDHAWARGDRLLTSSLEHHALARPARILAGHGVRVESLPRGGSEPLVLEALREALAAGGVRLVAVTAASNVTGEILPVDDIVRLTHEHGALCLVDAAQVAGWHDLSLDAMGADLVAFTGHKGPQAPWGIGGLYVAPGVALNSPSASCDIGGGDGPCAPMPGYCDVGSVDRAALAGLTAGLAWLGRPERADRLARARDQVERMTRLVEDAPGTTLYGPRDSGARMPTLAFTVDGTPSSVVAEDLAARGVLVAAGHQCAPMAHETLGTAEHGVVRISAGPSTTDDDVERALNVLGAVLG